MYPKLHTTIQAVQGVTTDQNALVNNRMHQKVWLSSYTHEKHCMIAYIPCWILTLIQLS